MLKRLLKVFFMAQIVMGVTSHASLFFLFGSTPWLICFLLYIASIVVSLIQIRRMWILKW